MRLSLWLQWVPVSGRAERILQRDVTSEAEKNALADHGEGANKRRDGVIRDG